MINRAPGTPEGSSDVRGTPLITSSPSQPMISKHDVPGRVRALDVDH